jgi:hypothetical protein
MHLHVRADSCNATQPLANYLSIRSQGINAARRLAGTIQYTHLDADCTPWGYFSITPEYSKSFDHKKINRLLFGDTACKETQITVSGSLVPNRGENDWLAEYLYLPPDFQSSLRFKPTIDNFVFDIDLYLSLSEWWDGVYVALYAPFVHTRWDLHMQECIHNPGDQGYPGTYFSPQPITRNQLQNNVTQFMNGVRLPAVVQPKSFDLAATATTPQVTIALDPLEHAKMDCAHRSRSGMSEIRFITGWDFCVTPESHMGLALNVSAPTGNRPTGEYLFEPIIGNGHHWELSGGFNGHWTVWQREDECASVTFFIDSVVGHFFNAMQHRTFDLKNKPFSRYMLAERMDFSVTSTSLPNSLNYAGFTASRPGPDGQFVNEFTPVANITNITVSVGVDVIADLTALATVHWNALSWDIGYEFWARTCDDISLKPNVNPPLIQSWSLKGDSFVFGINDTVPEQPVIALSASESQATIHAGTNVIPNASTFDAAASNPSIDNPVAAQTGITPLSAYTGAPINTSVDPIYINIPQDLDACGARTAGMSSKLFTHLQYNGDPEKHCAWIPFIGIGGEVEWAHTGKKYDCLRTNVSQWGVWVKGGIAFK